VLLGRYLFKTIRTGDALQRPRTMGILSRQKTEPPALNTRSRIRGPLYRDGAPTKKLAVLPHRGPGRRPRLSCVWDRIALCLHDANARESLCKRVVDEPCGNSRQRRAPYAGNAQTEDPRRPRPNRPKEPPPVSSQTSRRRRIGTRPMQPFPSRAGVRSEGGSVYHRSLTAAEIFEVVAIRATVP
jgi:hypothetical protein